MYDSYSRAGRIRCNRAGVLVKLARLNDLCAIFILWKAGGYCVASCGQEQTFADSREQPFERQVRSGTSRRGHDSWTFPEKHRDLNYRSPSCCDGRNTSCNWNLHNLGASYRISFVFWSAKGLTALPMSDFRRNSDTCRLAPFPHIGHLRGSSRYHQCMTIYVGASSGQ